MGELTWKYIAAFYIINANLQIAPLFLAPPFQLMTNL